MATKIDQPLIDALEEMARSSGRSVNEVLREAIGTQQFIQEAVAQRSEILVADNKGRISKLLF